jgi:hypothetical protein
MIAATAFGADPSDMLLPQLFQSVYSSIGDLRIVLFVQFCLG